MHNVRSKVVELVDSHAAVIINVMHGEHFVLVVGYDRAVGGDTLFVNDPGFNRPSYVNPPSSVNIFFAANSQVNFSKILI